MADLGLFLEDPRIVVSLEDHEARQTLPRCVQRRLRL
jgi:hypothetical protein